MNSGSGAARVLFLRGAGRHTGKTTLGMALGRWLWQYGVRVAPLHLSSPGDWDLVPCPEGGRISRPAALMAEACGLHPEQGFEVGPGGLAPLAERFEVILVEEASGSEGAQAGGGSIISISRAGRWAELAVAGASFRLEMRRVNALEPEDALLKSLPPWNFGGKPRIGIVSSPHMQGFEDYSLLRGAEWLTSPGIGLFDMLFLPHSEDWPTDRAWLGERGLWDWLLDQRARGCRVCAGSPEPLGFEYVDPETLRQPASVSLLTGVRWPYRPPDDSELASLADWLERSVGEQELKRLLP